MSASPSHRPSTAGGRARPLAAHAGRKGGHTLRVNPIACVAHGMCAELFPERISLDPWGYPVLDGEPVPPQALLDHARRAARACPTFALLLERTDARPHARPDSG